MADSNRIDELRRRLQKDPASIAFAQLAEEYRRAGRFQEAIETCRAGLARHPGYLSARVTFGRALLETGDLESAKKELHDVLRAAPHNLAAIRGLAEVHRRKGELHEALEQYRAAFELAQNDPGIDRIVRDLRRELAPAPAAGARPMPAPTPVPARVPPPLPAGDITPSPRTPAPRSAPASPAPRSAPASPPPHDAGADRARREVAALEGWLEAILAERRSRLYSSL